MSTRETVHAALIGLLRARGMSALDAKAVADSKLDEAVARVEPLIKNQRSLNDWATACGNLHAWLTATATQ